MKLSTKAQNLIILNGLRLKKSKIPKFIKYTVEDWILNENEIIKASLKKLNKKIIIRSSYILEDSEKYSMAGEFEGFSNVINTKKNIKEAVTSLIKQYKKKSKKRSHFLKSEIIFQNMILKTKLSGVLTNYCIKDGSFYYVINYDDTSGSTSSVTSGSKTGGRVINIFRDEISGVRSKKLKAIISSIKEIEEKIGVRPVDLEFAIDSNGIVNIFQIRPLTTIKSWKKISSVRLKKILKKNKNLFLKINKINSKYGNLPLFGLMPDWNPAEMIGYQPNKLSYSIYKEIITDDAWSIARQEMGYKKVLRPLMYKFTGKPFIDARLSFYSLIPSNIPHNLSKKIVNHWSKILLSKPYLHDKIEFEIADGSFDAQTKKKIKDNYSFLSSIEKKKYGLSLKQLTDFQIKNFEFEFDKNNKRLMELENARIELIDSFLKKNENFNVLMKNFLKKIKINGIVPFAKYARNAFIAKKILNSFYSKNYISYNKISKILNSLNTITSQFLSLSKLKNKSFHSKQIFENLFYHLRPGTYDITVKRAIPNIKKRKINNLESIISFENYPKNLLSEIEKKRIDKFLKKNNFNTDTEKLYNYMVMSLKLRENSKFIFTRALSDYLQIIEEWGKKKKINVEKLSNFDIKNILKNISNSNKKISYNSYKGQIDLNTICKLPYLITAGSDFFVASILISKPNFITENIVTSKIFHLKKEQNISKISGRIILIENADPGFDWIFNYKIKGLITKYGGVNSHMSIRCHELNIPAAIGVGEESFDKLISGNKVILNCKEKKFI